jgi:hypothetical protein
MLLSSQRRENLLIPGPLQQEPVSTDDVLTMQPIQPNLRNALTTQLYGNRSSLSEGIARLHNC